MAAVGSPSSTGVADAAVDVKKPKRVRTGCLTCRERHLKCDEGLPNCQNCKKSGKICKRGVKLNFHWIDVKDPAILPPTADWQVQFQDESRLIASEYRGGLGQYSLVDVDQTITPPQEPALNYSMSIDPSISVHDNLPPILGPTPPGLYPEAGGLKHENHSRDHSLHHSHGGSDVSFMPTAPSTSYSNAESILTPPNDTREYLSDPQEVLFMQVFVEEVGLWMDSMDPMKHFSRLLPFQALQEPMLLNAFLSCGARHLTLVNPGTYHEHKALSYYDTATMQLMNHLHNPDRDTVVCALTAVILNVYEIMSARNSQRMNHIAGARALIKECGWNARSPGVGAACFWLNVGMEVLSCLHFNWQTAWDPDQWGVDMDFSRYREPGNEDIWVHRILYITAKITNFRSTIPRFQEASAQDEQMRRQRRYAEWQNLKCLCENWNNSVPRTMHPMGFLFPHQTSSKSLFPEVWLIKRATITGRLFYHTCLCLIAQTNPMLPSSSPEMSSILLDHARQICGIVVHVKDRGVASVCLRSMAIAAEALVLREEQEEVMRIFQRIRKETGWNIEFLKTELPEKWGWNAEEQMLRDDNSLNSFFPSGQGSGSGNLPPAPQVRPQQQSAASAMRGGILNPLLAKADFNLPNHPYQAFYQPPRMHDLGHHNQFSDHYF